MRKSIRFILFYLQTFFSHHRYALIFSALTGFFVTILVFQIYPIYRKVFQEKLRTIGYIGQFSTRNLPLFIQQQISVGLTKIDENGLPVPAVATSWEFDRKGTTVKLHLRDDLTFHDGKKFSAYDVNYKIRGANLNVLDNTTLEVTLKEPFAPILSLLSSPIIRSPLLGLGSYQVKGLDVSEDIVTKLSLSPVSSDATSVTYKFYRNSKDAILAYKMGEVSEIKDIIDPQDLASWKGTTATETSLFDRYVGIFFNMSNPNFKEKEVRQALAYAISDLGNFQKAHTPISPLSWAYSSKVRLYDFDRDTARKILAGSPLASASSELVLSTFAQLLPQAQKITQYWQEVGIKSRVKVESEIGSDYQVFLITQSIPTDPDQYHYWQSTQGTTNITNYSSAKIDKLLEDGRKTYNLEERKKIYADFQRYLVDDAPVIFLYYPKVYTVERK